MGLFVASGVGEILGWDFFSVALELLDIREGRALDEPMHMLVLGMLVGARQCSPWTFVSEGLAQFTSLSKICFCGGDEEVRPSLSVVPVEELCNQQRSGLFLAMLASVRLSVVRKGPRSAWHVECEFVRRW